MSVGASSPRPNPRLHLLNPALERRAVAFVAAAILDPTDLLVVDAVAERFGETDPDVLLGLAFAVRAPRAGHVGVDHAPGWGGVDDERATWRASRSEEEVDAPLDWPEDPVGWQTAVLASPMLGGAEDATRPFVRQELADGRVLVMSRRMWREQQRLAEAALGLAASSPGLTLSDEVVASGVARLLGDEDSPGGRAVAAAARCRLTVVTGGPGTGKTWVIQRLLALILESSVGSSSPRIELAAPTGKAAVRMAEAVAEDLGDLDVDDGVRSVLAGLKPRTLHKLLGMRPDGSSRHGPERPLAADLVVVDEASMVDLVLMRRLFESLLDDARLVLIGDRDQLASVEAGTVLADLVGPVLDGSSGADGSSEGSSQEPLRGAVVHFDTNHRFAEAPTVAAIAAALGGRGDDGLEQVGRWMRGAEVAPGEELADRVTHLGVPGDSRPSWEQLDRLAAPFLTLTGEGFVGLLADAIRSYGEKAPELRDPSLHLRLLRALEGYRVLAVHRRGPLGVSGLDREIARRCRLALEQAIRDRRGLEEEAVVKLPARAGHWLGQPVLVTRNAYEVGLMNGDIGLVLPTAGGLAVVFPAKDGGVDRTRAVTLARLPRSTGAFVMTVHRSQGSQFRRVAVVLAGRDSPIQTRELIYTAITRTRSRLDWLGDPDELLRALRRRVGRASGLGDLVWRSDHGSG